MTETRAFGVRRTPFSFRALIIAFGLVAVLLPIALLAQLGNVRTLNALNGEIAQTREGALTTAEVVQFQLDEDTAIRGFAATGRRLFLEPYDRARAVMPARLATLEAITLADRATGADDRALADLASVNEAWLQTVAEPILRGARNKDALLVHSKTLIDRFRTDAKILDDHFASRYASATAERDKTIQTTTIVSIVAIAVIGIEIVVFGLVIARTRQELDRERGFVETLQAAASVRLSPPPYLAVGTAYRSATRGARIGGDVYDVYRVDPDRTLIVIGDVSGKGLSAAVDTTLVRFGIRALAGEGLSVDEIASHFDALYRQANPAPESFVTLFMGIYDRRDGTISYVNAGHEACWVRRGADVEQLAPTGPIVGLGGYPFAAARTPLGAGDFLVLTTDGITEAREPNGDFATAERVTAWIAEAQARTPQELVDALIARVRRFTRGRITDDLAILVVKPLS
ncbi:MAG: putative Serine phosphatase RsbU regulator sigma subunit [Candidatus Eremiobacteraeota bacterium]|nr:putative Serine phosphatase RsbU regulator sigma subunit [Candidatus Eremiobacteraeota bacterium]